MTIFLSHRVRLRASRLRTATLALFFLTLFYSAASLAAQSLSVVKGTIRDAKTNEPIPFSSISALGTSFGARAKVDGSFEFKLPSGKYQLRASAVGYTGEVVSVSLAEGQTLTQDFQLKENLIQSQEVLVTGTRRTDRTRTETPVPVDVITAQEMRQMGQTETSQIIQMLVPSFNFPRTAIADGTDAVRPATLRGLAPDQVLVLVNGKRRHTAALINVNGTVGRGSAAVDLNAIPASAIDRIEVLRDGAAAQYGSDAIAGVINVILKTDAPTYVSSTNGATAEGDGKAAQAEGSGSLKIGENGYVNLSGELRVRDYTNRSGTDYRRQYYLQSGGTAASALDPRENTIDRITHRYGDGATNDAVFFLNSKIPFENGLSFYAFSGFGVRQVRSVGFFRRSLDDRTVRTIHPDGFLPQIRSNVSDFSVAGGVDGVIKGWYGNFGVVFGRNAFEFNVDNSNNTSLGDTLTALDQQRTGLSTPPTSVRSGLLSFNQMTINLDFSKQFNVGLPKPLSVAFGGEFRNDGYGIEAGDPASYIRGSGFDTLVVRPDGTRSGTLTAPGIQVFPGFQPSDAGNYSRSNVAGYFDTEANLTSFWLLSGAVRYEYFTDFGSTFRYKTATRFQLGKALGLRASYSTGFRAPSLQQQFFSATATNFIGGVPFEVKTFPVTNSVAAALGARPLTAEKSQNIGTGITFDPTETLSFSVDYYNIAVYDRIVLSGNFTGTAITNFLASRGFVGVGGGRFFTNAIDTRTQGVEVVARYAMDLKKAGIVRFTGGFSYNETEITGINTPTPPQLGDLSVTLFDRFERIRVERGQPRTTLNLMLNYNIGDFALMVRGIRYGEFTTTNFAGSNVPGVIDVNGPLTIGAGASQIYFPDVNIFDQTYPALWVTDIDVSYKLFKKLTLAVGGNNVFNVYPQRSILIPGNDNNGRITPFSGQSPSGFNGAFYYGRVAYNF
jgi:iron complex outermembrane recepter protein